MSVIVINPYNVTPTVQATVPSPLIAFSLDTTTAYMQCNSTGADSYTFQRATQSDYSDAVEIQATSATSVTDTGRTEGTTYYYRVKAVKSGYRDSDWVTTSVTTIGPMPLAVWDFTGLEVDLATGNGVTNSYGTTGNTGTITGVNSVIETTGPDLSDIASAYPVLKKNAEHFSYNVLRTNNQYFGIAPDLVLSSDFTICFQMNSLPVTVVHYLLSNTGFATSNWIFMQQNRVDIRFNTTTSYSVTFPETLSDTRRIYKIIIQKNGTNLRVSVDGGTTWSANTAVAGGLTMTINRIFASNAGGNVFDKYIDRIWVDDAVLTQSQIDQRFNYLISTTEAPEAEDTAIVPSGNLTYADLVNGYVDDVTTASTIGSPSKKWIVTNGPYSYILSNGPTAAPNYSYQRLHVFKHVANQSASFNIGYITASTDIHNFGGLGRIGNRVIHLNQTAHYDDSSFTSLVLKSFNEDFNFDGLTEYPQHKGVPSINWNQTQYHQLDKIGNTFYLFMQEYAFTSASGHRALVGKSTDMCKSWTKIPTVDLGSGTKFIYDQIIYSGVSGEIYILSYIADASVGGKNLTSHFRRTSDGITYSNLSGSYSKNVLTGGPLTESELNTNFQLKDGSASAQGTQVGQGFVTSDGIIYFTIYDGTKWQFAYGSVGGSFTYVDIPWDGKTIVTNTLTGSGAYVSVINRAIPVAVRISGNTYDYYALEDNSTFWRVVKFRTTDLFATGSFVENVTNDNTKQHNLITISPNYEYSNHAVLACTGATAADAGKLFIDVIK